MLKPATERCDASAVLPACLLGRMLDRLRPRRITAVAYHRIVSDDAIGDIDCEVNYSAAQSTFRRHIKILAVCTNPVRVSRIASWLRNEDDLPPNASVVTFDDGYRDNLTNALPILLEERVPAAIYLSTGHVGTQTPLFWDLAAQYFRLAEAGTYQLPLMGEQTLDRATRDGIAKQWIATAKQLSPDSRGDAMRELGKTLNNSQVASDAFQDIYLSWDEVRHLSAEGIEFGAHTVNHPILSTITDADAKREIIESRQRIERELGAPPCSFAYPNGLRTDYTQQHIEMLRDAGFDMAFTLVRGPTTRAAVRARPYQVARIYVGLKDRPLRFVLKLWGMGRRSC